MVSFGPSGTPANGSSEKPSTTIIPAPNRVLVAYASEASNLIAGDSNAVKDIFLATIKRPDLTESSRFPDLVSTELISRPSATTLADGASSEPNVSGDGKYVTFASVATNLIPGTVLSGKQIYRYDVTAKTIALISKDSLGQPANADCSAPVIRYNGRFIAYVTRATNVISDASGSVDALVIHDTMTGTSSRINQSTAGVAGNGSASRASMFPNGRFLAFSDTSSNLVDDDTNNVADVFIRDLETNVTTRASLESGAEGNGASDSPTMSGAAFNDPFGLIAYRSFASNLCSAPTGGQGDIRFNRVSLPKPTFTQNSRLEVPADVTVGTKKAKIETQEFGAIDLPGSSGASISASTTLKYEVRVQGTGSRSNFRYRLITKRNAITVKNLKSGTYTTRYRVIATSTSGTTTTTAYSPTQRFTVE